MNPVNERKELIIFKDQLSFLNSDYQTIIFTEDACFFYNKNERKIRSFNSIIWFSVDKFHIDDFIDHLNKRIEEIYSNPNDRSVFNKSSDGYFFDGKVIINLSNFYLNIPNEGESNLKILNDLYDFIFYLERIYKDSEKFLNESINFNIDLL